MSKAIGIGKVRKLNLDLPPKVAENSFFFFSLSGAVLEKFKCMGRYGVGENNTFSTEGASRGQEKRCQSKTVHPTHEIMPSLTFLGRREIK